MNSRQKTTGSSIPEDIILVEILPRLPVKSVLRFKAVSKSWLSHVSTEKFEKTHHKLSPKNDNDTPLTDYHAISVSPLHRDTGYYLNHCLPGLFSQSTMSCVDPFPCRQLYIVGCSNGLCCVLQDKCYFILWNPSTRKSRTLPPASNEFEIIDVSICGFGYDESNDDYKVVATFRCRCMSDSHQYIFKLYSLKTNSWKTINDYRGGYTNFFPNGVVVNGKLHWMTYHTNIVSFDLRMEVVGAVETPPSFANFIRPYQKTGVIKGCLCVMGNVPNEGTQVWVMEEYGVKESWRKMWTIPCLGIGTSCYPYNRTLCVSEACVLTHDRKFNLFLVDPNNNGSIILKVKVSQIDFCIPSLVSPFRNSEFGKPK